MRRERALLLDGVGVPDRRGRAGRPAGAGRRGRATTTTPSWRGSRPSSASTGRCWSAWAPAPTRCARPGTRPHLIVGDPAEISNEALTCGADVVVPAFADGHAPGLHRVQDLGAGAVTFPSSANPEDLALLLAAHHGAALVVTVGLSATHGRVPRPRPLRQQRLDVPHPAAARRRGRGRPGDRRAATAAGSRSARSC